MVCADLEGWGGVRGVQSKIGLGPPFANNITPPPKKNIFWIRDTYIA